MQSRQVFASAKTVRQSNHHHNNSQQQAQDILPVRCATDGIDAQPAQQKNKPAPEAAFQRQLGLAVATFAASRSTLLRGFGPVLETRRPGAYVQWERRNK